MGARQTRPTERPQPWYPDAQPPCALTGNVAQVLDARPDKEAEPAGKKEEMRRRHTARMWPVQAKGSSLCQCPCTKACSALLAGKGTPKGPQDKGTLVRTHQKFLLSRNPGRLGDGDTP